MELIFKIRCNMSSLFFKGLTVKELEDLIEMQKKLLSKLKNECKVLNEQLEILAVKYK